MNSFELIETYLPKAVDKYFAEDSKTAILERGNKFIDVKFDQTGYVKIASILMDGLSDYYQTQESNRPTDPANYAAYAGNVTSGSRDGFAIGSTSITWEIFRLQFVRGKQFRIDYISDEETAGIIIGNAIEEFNRLKVIPEVDASRFSLIADTCSTSLGNLLNEAPTADDIVSKFNAGFEWLSENEVPEEQQVIFVNPAIMTAIRNSKELTKFLTQGDYKSDAGIDFTVTKYAGRPIIEVPSNRFFTNILLTQNGYRAQATSYVINYMICSVRAVVPVRKLEWNKIYGPEQSGIAGFHGYLINYLLYHGVFVPRNKVAGVYTSISNTVKATTKVNTLRVDTREGAAQYGWKLNNFFTSPAGMNGTVYYNTSALTLGGKISSYSSAKVATLGVENTESAASKSYYFALVDASGLIIAVSGQVSVAQKA